MTYLYVIYSILLGGLVVAGIREQQRHFANLGEIPARILVNGIRGKSSITRLCAGALRGGELVVCAKTTGSAARFIWPDGHESKVFRPFGIVNVSEQLKIVAQARTQHPDVLVMECMAVDPDLQELNQAKLVRSTIGVISNVREDHVEEMGPTLEDVARALSRTMPWDGVCVTAERTWWNVLAEEAQRRRCRLVYADPETVGEDELEPFRWFTLKENVAIALAVARELGVPRAAALRGMYAAAPDPGVLTVKRYELGGKTIRFANVFAANDPRSTVMNVERLVRIGEIEPPIIALVNCRPDRVDRNVQMGEIVPDLGADKLIVIGHPSRSTIAAVRAGWSGEVVDLGGEDRDGDELLRAIVEEVDAEASVVAIGNIHGRGEVLLEHLEDIGAAA